MQTGSYQNSGTEGVGNAHAVGFMRHIRNSLRLGKATYPRNVWLNDIQMRIPNKPPESPTACVLLSGRNTKRSGITQALIVLNRFRRERFFHPINAELLKFSGGLHGHLQGITMADVDHHFHFLTRSLLRCCGECDILSNVLSQRSITKFYGGKALLNVAMHRIPDFFCCLWHQHARVGTHILAEASSQQLVNWFSGGLSQYVPQRHVDTAYDVHDQSKPSIVIGLAIHQFPYLLDIEWIQADQDFT